jgi:hypothetical protein
MRGLDRVIKHYVTLSPDELAAARAQHERNIDQVAAELTDVDQDTRRPGPAPGKSVDGSTARPSLGAVPFMPTSPPR